MGLKANTTYLVQRAQEGVGGRPLGGDGICQRSLSLFPWSSSDAAALSFQTVPLPNTGPLISITTAANGDGSLDFEFRTLMLLAGTTNDVMYRLIDNDAAPTTELRSACMTYVSCFGNRTEEIASRTGQKIKVAPINGRSSEKDNALVKAPTVIFRKYVVGNIVPMK